MKKVKIKPAEKIVEILRSLSRDHSEMSLGFHIIMATEGTSIDILSDKELLTYLEEYQGSLSLDEQIEDENELDFMLSESPYYENEIEEEEED